MINRVLRWGLPVGFLAYATASLTGAYMLMRRRAPDPSDPPSNYGVTYNEVWFTSRDGVRLHGWFIPAPDKQTAKGTIISCHGQEGSKDGDTRQVIPIQQAGYNLFMFDFRAHGQSDGRQTTFGMYEKEDLMGAVDYLNKQGVEKVGVVGFSMGGATALICAALTDRIACVVADSAFGRLKATLTRWVGARGVPHAMARRFASSVLWASAARLEARIDQVDPVLWTPHIGERPLLFIYGENDEFVSVSEVEQMTSTAAGPVDTWIVPGANHRGAGQKDPNGWNERVIGFFDRHLAGKADPGPGVATSEPQVQQVS